MNSNFVKLKEQAEKFIKLNFRMINLNASMVNVNKKSYIIIASCALILKLQNQNRDLKTEKMTKKLPKNFKSTKKVTKFSQQLSFFPNK